MGINLRALEKASLLGYASVPEAIISLYEEGVPVSSIATQLGISRSTIYAILKRAGVRPRRPGGRSRTYSLRERFYDGAVIGPPEEVREAFTEGSTYLVRIFCRCGQDTAKRLIEEWKALTPEEQDELIRLVKPAEPA